ncbi:carboxylesterase/lipase family protein [Sphingomonas sp.]|jgi:para-nitrobenzyl esterase|uniref:carboxylesterase/lipase family protein n=1 Tax=Sphingomonas sp. TaxID=28214 RepID=UPI002D7E1B5C|nr:carboxylesterase family protein [Sphingomonas sp.]HEU0043967.1 carboxylesterase family protein [Sphingomonas sp.]
MAEPDRPTRRTVMAGATALVAAGAAFGRTGAAEVACPAGRFAGERLDNGVTRFLGIRYGRAERFRAPTAEPQARDVQPARAFGPVCPQRGKRQPQSEDCLFLNIWTPEARSGARLPVMVYIHGGAYAFGSGSDPVSDGRHLAGREVVVVTINHRLNALGYLYLARLDPRFPDSGNAGQLDLVLALRWVRDNIAAFGGDPARVMAFGDSGGGGKVTTLLAMPAAQGLIHRAATMSGQQVTASGPRNATRRAQAFLTKLGVGVSEAAALPVERLIAALDAEDPVLGGPVYMGPVLDLRSLPRHPFWPDAPAMSRHVPMMTGNARDEMRAFVDPDAPFVSTMSWSNVAPRIADELPVDVAPERIVAEYRRRLPTASPADVYFLATTAGRSWRGQLEVAEARARADAPVWFYQVDFTSRADPRRGAFHCIDVPLVFGTANAPGAGTGEGPDVRAASRAMQDRFVAFARTGAPDLPGASPWPRYTLERRATMVFDVGGRIVDDPRGWQRELFAVAPYTQPGS